MSVKVGIIGCGNIANHKHLPALSAIEGIEVVGYCDIIFDKALKTRQNFKWRNAKIFQNYKDLLLEKMDAVYVLTPNRTHSQISIEAMLSGFHVMCEKPMAISSFDAFKMLQTAKKTGKILTIGYQNRFRMDSLYLKKCCKQDDLGDIYFGIAHALRRRGVPTWGEFLNEKVQGGGPLIDIGAHSIDLVLWMMNNYRPISITCSTFRKLNDKSFMGNLWGDWDVEKYTVEDSAFGLVRMENGATILVESSWALNIVDFQEASVTLCGTKAGADMKNGLRINYIKKNKPIVECIECYNNDFDTNIREQKNFINGILGKEETVVKPEEAYKVSQIIEALYDSAKLGKTIYLNGEE